MRKAEIIYELESISNFLSNLWIDPKLPKHMKEAIKLKRKEIEDFIERSWK